MANKHRQVVDSGLSPVGFRPSTEHVNVYQQTTAGQKLGRLAESLSQLAPSLMRFSNQRAEEDKQSALAKADADMRMWDEARADNDGLKQAIKEGAIRPDQSPWYRWAAKQYFGRKAVGDYEALLTKRVEEDLGGSYDVEDFNELETATRKDFMEGFAGKHRDETFDLAFGREADSRVAGMRTNFARMAGARLQKFTLDNLSAVTAESIINWWAEAPDHDAPDAMKGLAAKIQTEMDRLEGVGEHPALVNNAIRKALQTVAMQRGMEDVDVVALAQEIVTDKKSGAKLGMIAEVQQELDTARDHRIADNNQLIDRERHEAEFAKQETYKTTVGEYVASLAASTNPATMQPEAVIAQMRAAGITDPSMLAAPYTFYKSAIEGNSSNQQLFNDLWVGVSNGQVGLGAIQRAVGARRISAHDGAFLWSAALDRERRSSQGSPAEMAEEALRSPVWSKFEARFRARFEGLEMNDVRKGRVDDALSQAQDHWIAGYSGTRQQRDAGTSYLNNIGESVWRGSMDPSDRDSVLTDLGGNNRWRREDNIPDELLNHALSEITRTGGLGLETAREYARRGILPEQAVTYTREQAKARQITPPSTPAPATQAAPAKAATASKPRETQAAKQLRIAHATAKSKEKERDTLRAFVTGDGTALTDAQKRRLEELDREIAKWRARAEYVQNAITQGKTE